MGSSGSKVARSESSRVRSFPKTANIAATQARAQPAQQQYSEPAQRYPPPQTSTTRNQAINIDARDPAFASRLQKLGIVQPNPFIPLSQQPSNTQNQSQPLTDTSTNEYTPPQADVPDPFAALAHNPALLVLRAREALQRQHDLEQEQIGTKGFVGRTSLDVGSLREAVRLRGQGVKSDDIEKKFGLKRGLLSRIGPKEVVDVVR